MDHPFYIGRCDRLLFENYGLFLYLNIVYILVNIADPDESQIYIYTVYQCTWFLVKKGLIMHVPVGLDD